jgi:hypothetical protein
LFLKFSVRKLNRFLRVELTVATCNTLLLLSASLQISSNPTIKKAEKDYILNPLLEV